MLRYDISPYPYRAHIHIIKIKIKSVYRTERMFQFCLKSNTKNNDQDSKSLKKLEISFFFLKKKGSQLLVLMTRERVDSELCIPASQKEVKFSI